MFDNNGGANLDKEFSNLLNKIAKNIPQEKVRHLIYLIKGKPF